MVAIFTGAGTGFERGSGNVVGAVGLLGSAAQGRGGDNLFFNAANGNLLISRQDEFLVGRGPDVGINRTYNSLGDMTDDNQDNWRHSYDRRVFGLTGTVNTLGSTVKRVSGDGSEITYTWNNDRSAYVTTDGAGAYDTLTFSGTAWTWTDGDSQIKETYETRVYGLTGTLNTSGSTVRRRADNGTEVEYTWSATGYFSGEGHKLTHSGSTWTWTEAGTARIETYDTAVPQWRLTFQKDTSDNSLTFTYRGSTLKRVTTANGEYTEFGWSGNNITQIAVYGTGSGNNLLLTRTRYTYDEGNRLTTVTVDKSPTDSSVADGKSYVTTYTYHGTSKRVATISQTDGSSVSFTYDGSDRLTSFAQTVTNGVMRTTNISYHTEIVDGVTKKYTKVTASGLETRLHYTNDGFLTKVTSPAADGSAAPQTIHFGYSAKGDLTSVTDPAGQTTTYDHDDNGNVDYINDRLNHIVTRTYGSQNQLLTETRTAASQDSSGSSLTSRYVYDDKTRLVATVSAEGRVTRFGYDSFGQLGGSVTITADPYDLTGLGSTDTISATQINDWYVRPTDKSQVIRTGRGYDVRGNLSWEKAYSAAAMTGGANTSQGWSQTDYVYDQSGQLLSRTRAGLSTERYAYDGLGRTIASTDLGGAWTTIVFHDAATTTTVSVEGGLTRTSVYNKAGELISTSESPAPVVSENLKPDLTNPGHWTVGGNLEVTSATSIAGQPAWLYTIKANGGGGALSTLGTVNAGETLTFEITLKAQGNTPTHYFGTYGAVAGWGANEISTATVISGPGTVAQATGSLWSVSGLSTTQETRIRVTRTSPVTEQVYPHFYVGAINGAQVGDNVILSAPSVTRQTPQPAGPTTEYLYDALGRLRSTIQHTDAQGTNGYAQHIVYDNAGRMTAQVDHTGALTEYHYDVNNRVIATTRYANKLSATNLAQVADPNSGAAIGTIRPAADTSGDLWTWTRYDAEGQVTRAIDGDGSVISYTYDASGQLIKTVGYATKLSSANLATLRGNAADTTVGLPSSSTVDAITRAFYDKDGRAIGALDALGYLSEIVYDKAGRKVQEIAYANPTSASGDLRASGTFIALRTSAGTTASDRSTRYIYDGQGLLRYTIDGLNQVIGYVYSDGLTTSGTTHGQVRQTIAYAGTIESPTSYTVAGVEQKLSLAGLTAHAINRSSFAVYDSAGRLAYAIGAEGLVTSYTYNTLGQVIKTVAFANARATTSLPSKSDMDNWVASNAANPDNRVTRSYYNGFGDLAYAVDAEGYVTETTYDPLRRVNKTIRYSGVVAPTDSWTTSTVAAAGKGVPTTTATITYDYLGRVETVADAANTITRNDYSATGLLIETIAAENTAVKVTTKFTYDATGRLKTRTDGHGTAEAVKTRYEYDGFGNLTKVWVADGTSDVVVTAYTYDALGRVLSVTEGYETPEAATIEYVYDAFGNAERIKDAEGNFTFNYFDELGRIVATRDPEHYVTQTSYTVFGEVASVTRRHNKATNSASAAVYPVYAADAKDATTSFTYTKLGQVKVVTDAENSQTTTNYNAFGQVQSVTRAGATTAYQFDKLGRTKVVTDAGNIPTMTVYTPMGEIQSVTRDGATTRFEYDVLGRVTKSIDAEGWFETYAYDALGRRTSVTNKIGGVTEYKYDSRGRQIEEVIWVSGAYNGDTTLTSTTIVNKFEYDLRGNLLESIEAWGAPEARTTTYIYDTLDRIVTKTGMQFEVTDVLNSMATTLATPTETYVYDKRGNVIETKLESVVGETRTLISRSLAFYDGLGRAVARINPLGAVVSYAYDKNGNVTSTRAYDDKVTLPATPGGSFTPTGAYRETVHSYDRINRLKATSVVVPFAGRWDGSNFVIERGPDNTPLAVENAKYDYDAHGNVIKTTDANGNSVFAWYDALGRKTAQVDQERYLTTWTHDANGNVLGEWRYANKVTGSFTEATNPSTLPGLLGAGAADLTRITTFLYDMNGRRTAEVRYDVRSSTIAANGVITETFPTAAVIYYAYNGLGQVTVKQEANNDTTNYTYDNAGRLIVEKRAGYTDHQGNFVNPTVRYYYDGLDQLTSTRQGAFAAHADDRITTNSYAAGRLASTTDAALKTRSYHYDVAGRVVAESYVRTLSNGSTVEEAVISAYDAGGQVVTQSFMRKANGSWVNTYALNQAYVSTHMRYNAHGELTDRGMAAGLTAPTTYQEFFNYDAAGRMWRTNSGDGVTKFMVYDKAGNQTLTLTSTGADLSTLDFANTAAWLSTSGDTSLTGAVTSINVYDKRGMVVETREPDRELKVSSPPETVTIIRKRAYNAFGEVASETDARNYTTTFVYNTMGRLITKVSPQVNATAENGTVSTINPTEHYRYDISGRMIATVDANGNTRARALLSGTGHGDSEALVTHMFNADGGDANAIPDDGGVIKTFYDRFGDARILRNELGSTNSSTAVTTATDEQLAYDKMGRVTTIIRRGGLLTESYTYDELGQRIQYWNSQLAVGVKDLTDYDVQGRIVSSTSIAGDQTITTYAWDAGLQSAIGAPLAVGGWVRTVSTIADRASASDAIYATVERENMFGRMVDRQDMGGRDYDFAYDLAGRLTSQSIKLGSNPVHTGTYAYYNTGQIQTYSEGAGTIATNSDWERTVAEYEYDADGRTTVDRLYKNTGTYTEGSTDPEGVWTDESYYVSTILTRDGRASYDALGRMADYRDNDVVGGLNVEKIWAYDAASNVRSVSARYRPLEASGTFGALPTTPNQIFWYRYDNMNRVVTTKGILSDGVIVRGSTGTDITYDAANNRTSVTNSDGTTEIYGYRADGQLMSVSVGGATRASYTRDASGRITEYSEFDASGVQVHRRYDIAYNARGQILAEKSKTKQGSDWIYAHTVSYFSADGLGSLPSLLQMSAATTGASTGALQYGSSTKYWKSSSGAYSPVYALIRPPGEDTSYPDSTSLYGYVWRDGALQSNVQLQNKDGNTSTIYAYDGAGHLDRLYKTGGTNPYTVYYTTDSAGLIIQRDESYVHPATNAPSNIHYYFAGQRMGDLSDNGTDDLSYAASIASRTATPGTGRFRGGASSGTAYADFDQSYDPINGWSEAGAGSITANDGDTFQSLAAAIWGDASLWYKLAEANGLSASSVLVAGQMLTVPGNVHNIHNSSSTFQPYDPAAAIGDVSPNTPKPKKNNCAFLGAILIAIVAVAVTIALRVPAAQLFQQLGLSATLPTGAAAMGAVGTAGGGIGLFSAAGIAGTIGAAAAGSVVSQAFGLATGLQQGGFNWKGVGLAAIGAGVGLGVGAVFGQGAVAGSQVFGDFVRGAAGSAVTQGVGRLTGLQDKFSWAGVAAAGMGSALGGIAMRTVGGEHGKFIKTTGHESGLPKGSWDWDTAYQPSFGVGLAASGASLIASAATRSVMEGTSFGDNVIAGLPDVIGQAVGGLVAEAISNRSSTQKAEREDRKLAEATKLQRGEGKVDEKYVTKAMKLLDKSFGGITFSENQVMEIASLKAAGYSNSEIRIVIEKYLAGAGIDNERMTLAPAAMREREAAGVKEVASGWKAYYDSVGKLYTARSPSRPEVEEARRLLDIDISGKEFVNGPGDSIIASVALSPAKDGRVVPAITLGNRVYFNSSYFRHDYLSRPSDYSLFVHEIYHFYQYEKFGESYVKASIVRSAARYGGEGAYKYYARQAGHYDKNGNIVRDYPDLNERPYFERRAFVDETFEAQAKIASDYATYEKFGVVPVYRSGVLYTARNKYGILSTMTFDRKFTISPPILKQWAKGSGVLGE